MITPGGWWASGQRERERATPIKRLGSWEAGTLGNNEGTREIELFLVISARHL
jgi:hypothetical protein